MQQHPLNNNAKIPNPGTHDPDVLSAIAAAAAAFEDHEDASDPATSPTSSEGEGETAEANEPTVEEKTDKQTIQHDHRNEICEDEYDAMLNQAFEDRETLMAKRKKRFRIATATCFLITVGAASGWYAASESNREKVHNLWGDTVAITKEVQESTDVASIVDKYDASLEKIEERQGQVADAAAELGIDQASDTAKGQSQLDEAMKTVTGDTRTVAQRDAALKKRFGKMAEETRKEIEANRATEQTKN